LIDLDAFTYAITIPIIVGYTYLSSIWPSDFDRELWEEMLVLLTAPWVYGSVG